MDTLEMNECMSASTVAVLPLLPRSLRPLNVRPQPLDGRVSYVFCFCWIWGMVFVSRKVLGAAVSRCYLED